MPASPHVSEKRSLLRDALLGSLLLAVVGLTILVCRQRWEILRLSQAMDYAAERPAVMIRTAHTRSLSVLPRRAESPVRQDFRAMDDGGLANSTESGRATRARSQPASALVRLLDNPEFFQALELHRQATLDARFAGLFRRLALGTDELAAFKRLLAEKENVALDVVAVGETQPEGPVPVETLQASITAARAKVEEAIRASLGGDRYAVYREYEQTQPQRAVVAQLEQRLSYSAAPLAPAQADALVRILATHAPEAASAGASAPAVVVGSGAPAAIERLQSETAAAKVSDAALVEAQAVLTVPQQAALRQIQAEQQASLLALQLIGESLPVGDDRQHRLLRLLLQ